MCIAEMGDNDHVLRPSARGWDSRHWGTERTLLAQSGRMTLAWRPAAFLDPWFWWDRAADCMIPPKLEISATKTCGTRWAAAEPRRQPRDQGCAENWCVIAGRTRWVLVGTDAGVQGYGPMLQCAGQTNASGSHGSMPQVRGTNQCLGQPRIDASGARDKPMPRAATDRCLRPVASSDASVPLRMIRRRAALERQQLRRHAGTPQGMAGYQGHDVT
jgi:hypothetical protein